MERGTDSDLFIIPVKFNVQPAFYQQQQPVYIAIMAKKKSGNANTKAATKAAKKVKEKVKATQKIERKEKKKQGGTKADEDDDDQDLEGILEQVFLHVIFLGVTRHGSVELWSISRCGANGRSRTTLRRN